VLDAINERLQEVAISQPMTAPSKILSSVRKEFNDKIPALQALASDSVVCRTIRRYMQPKGLKNPQSRGEINLSSEDKKTYGNAEIMFRDFGGDERILIFTTRSNLQVSYAYYIT
jgi:hypothetical protein